MTSIYRDWGEASEKYDEIRYNIVGHDLSSANEAQTRFDVIDRLIREVLGWQHGQIAVEEFSDGERAGYVDYILRAGDRTIVVEAKRAGAAFPSPTRKTQLKLSGSVLSTGEVGKAIEQAEGYAREKDADVVVVTNGTCWCFFSLRNKRDDSYATILFPVEQPTHAEQLFNTLAETAVEAGSLVRLTGEVPLPENRLVTAFRWADSRIDRNDIADHIMPALERALYADAILVDAEQLARCFITTEARSKYDSALGIHLADPKAGIVETAQRIRTGQTPGPLQAVVDKPIPRYAPPVTVLMGSVGSGKSTYLKHFELVTGRGSLAAKKAHWIYIDFEAMGRGGDPRQYMYSRILAYLESDAASESVTYRKAVEPAYKSDISAWARGPLAPIATNKEEFNKRVAERISADHDKVEPYVDKVLGYIATQQLCVVVLDNIDLYEDDELETEVFAEGLALSRRIQCHVIVSLRDTTFVRHRTDSAFDAYELNKLWLDPPPLKAVISSRLSYSRTILKGQSARLTLPNGMTLVVPDLSVFFDIVQRSILSAEAGDFVEALSDGNVRRGLTLVKSFLTSGHIEANRAMKSYLQDGKKTYTFPFHEIFKGTMLGQWLHFREDRAECINVFDSRLGSKRLQLLRLLLLNDLWLRAQEEHSLEVPVSTCIDLLGGMGASPDNIIQVLQFMQKHGLIRNTRAEAIAEGSTVVLTRSGGYYTKFLTRNFVYVEESMFDTAIQDGEVWSRLRELTVVIEGESDPAHRMDVRKERITMFLDYLTAREREATELLPAATHLPCLDAIRTAVIARVDDARTKIRRYPLDSDQF